MRPHKRSILHSVCLDKDSTASSVFEEDKSTAHIIVRYNPGHTGKNLFKSVKNTFGSGGACIPVGSFPRSTEAHPYKMYDTYCTSQREVPTRYTRKTRQDASRVLSEVVLYRDPLSRQALSTRLLLSIQDLYREKNSGKKWLHSTLHKEYIAARPRLPASATA